MITHYLQLRHVSRRHKSVSMIIGDTDTYDVLLYLLIIILVQYTTVIYAFNIIKVRNQM